jgi:hypothetical protein
MPSGGTRIGRRAASGEADVGRGWALSTVPLPQIEEVRERSGYRYRARQNDVPIEIVQAIKKYARGPAGIDVVARKAI